MVIHRTGITTEDKIHYHQTEINTAYSPETDMTFLLEEEWGWLKDQEPTLLSTRVIGFHYGEPDSNITPLYIGELEAKY